MSFDRPRGLHVEDTEGGPRLVHGDPRSAPSRQPASERSTVHLVVDGPQDRADAASLCARLLAALAGRRVELVVCDVAALTEPDVGTVDVLARMELTARRRGCEMRLEGASVALRELLALVGLREVVPCEAGSDLEARRQPEGREEAPRVEEEGDPADPTA
jgi:ABC-type transporter Mla MlaB component